MGQEMMLPPGMSRGMSTVLAAHAAANDELSGGITSSFAVLGYRGKVWRVKYRKNTENIVDDRGNAVPNVELVIVRASPNLSKVYYEKGFQEDAAMAPDCASSNNIAPDANVPKPQSKACAICPKNKFGSRITENGREAKACSDHKRVVVLPLNDLGNEVHGGPMLLRIPAASLGELTLYSNVLKQAGFVYFGVGTSIKFDIDEAYPKLLLSAVRVLEDDEAEYVLSLRDDPQVLRILNESPAGDEEVEPPAHQEPEPEKQQEAPKAAPARAAPAQAPAALAPSARAPAPVAQAPTRAAPAQAPAQAPARAAPPARTAPPPPAQAPVATARAAVPAPRTATARPAASPITAAVNAPAPKVTARPAPVEQENAPAPAEFDSELDSQIDNLLADA